MKKFLALLLVLLFLVSAIGCTPNMPPVDKESDSDPVSVTDPVDSDPADSDPVESDPIEIKEGGITLSDEFSFVARNDDDKIKFEADFTMICDVDSEYLRVDNGINYVSYLAPQIEVGGAAVIENNELFRLPSSVVNSTGNPDIKKYADNSAGATVRFATTAGRIKIKAKFSDKYTSVITAGRGSYGIEVFVGSGTDRQYVYSNVLRPKLDAMADLNFEREYSLPSGYKEVLILLPQGATVDSFEIGFTNIYDGIAVPLERDLAPVVFYGSKITQGISATKPGTSYTNLVSRMLNADAINLGFIGEVKGEKAIAEYIASLDEISAFVMEFDNAASIEDLKANHYNFYKTVRDAHSDIPIIIMSDPCFSDKQIKEATERVQIISDTYNKALEAGDTNIYFLDGRSSLPYAGDLAELLTTDNECPSDTGMYFIAAAVYDIIKSAYTPDFAKSGVDRKPGDPNYLELNPIAADDDVSAFSYTKVSDIDSKYVDSTKNGVTYLKFNTPQFELAGVKALKTPNSKSDFIRIEESRANEFFNTLLDGANYRSLVYQTSGGTLRFCTNADEIVIKAKLTDWSTEGKHMAASNYASFSVYVGTGTEREFVEMVSASSLNATVKLPEGYKEVMIDFPLYSGVKNLSIGFKSGDEIAAPTERDMKQICFYGSSITQGCSASRSGLHYPNIVTRMLNADNKGLGFSGSARGEQIMAEYIASLDLSIFVMDYDENSSAAELKQNHYNFYKTIREANPDLPILMLTCPKFTEQWNSDDSARVKVIRDTYEKAIKEGDTNIYIFEASGYFPHQSTMPDIYAADMIHPNTMAMYYMAKAVYENICDILAE